MKSCVGILSLLLLPALAPAADLKFRVQEIDATLKCGYGVVIADVNGDGKPDIIATGRQTGRSDLLERGAEVSGATTLRNCTHPGCNILASRERERPEERL